MILNSLRRSRSKRAANGATPPSYKGGSSSLPKAHPAPLGSKGGRSRLINASASRGAADSEYRNYVTASASRNAPNTGYKAEEIIRPKRRPRVYEAVQPKTRMAFNAVTPVTPSTRSTFNGATTRRVADIAPSAPAIRGTPAHLIAKPVISGRTGGGLGNRIRAAIAANRGVNQAKAIERSRREGRSTK